jgi:hypothetical protein
MEEVELGRHSISDKDFVVVIFSDKKKRFFTQKRG